VWRRSCQRSGATAARVTASWNDRVLKSSMRSPFQVKTYGLDGGDSQRSARRIRTSSSVSGKLNVRAALLLRAWDPRPALAKSTRFHSSLPIARMRRSEPTAKRAARTWCIASSPQSCSNSSGVSQRGSPFGGRYIGIAGARSSSPRFNAVAQHGGDGAHQPVDRRVAPARGRAVLADLLEHRSRRHRARHRCQCVDEPLEELAIAALRARGEVSQRCAASSKEMAPRSPSFSRRQVRSRGLARTLLRPRDLSCQSSGESCGQA
jgi:hypothetical protein